MRQFSLPLSCAVCRGAVCLGAVCLGALLAMAPVGAALAQQTEPNQQVTPPPGTGPNAGSSVIRPPAGVDPGINRPTPRMGAAPGTRREVFPTPVVPPPGAPGGNPNVVPK